MNALSPRVGRSLEWRSKYSILADWRLTDGEEKLASLRYSIRRECFTGDSNGLRFDIRHVSGDVIPVYLRRYPSDYRVVYSIFREESKGEWDGNDTKQEWGRLEHGHDLFSGTTKIVLKDGRTYYIKSGNKMKKWYEYMFMIELDDVKALGITKRSKNKMWFDFHPGTFLPLQFEEGDLEPEMVAVLTFAFCHLVHINYDHGWY